MFRIKLDKITETSVDYTIIFFDGAFEKKGTVWVDVKPGNIDFIQERIVEHAFRELKAYDQFQCAKRTLEDWAAHYQPPMTTPECS